MHHHSSECDSKTTMIRVALWLVQCCALMGTSSGKTEWDRSDLAVPWKVRVEVICMVENIKFFDIVRIEYLVSGGDVEVVADNNVLKPLYEKQNRFKARFDTNFTEGISNTTLIFEDTRLTDSGYYLCKNMQYPDEPPGILNLTVLVPVKETYAALIDLNQFDATEESSESSNFSSAFFASLQPIEGGASTKVEAGSGLVCYATSDGPNFELKTLLEGEEIDPDNFQVKVFEHLQEERGDSLENFWKANVVQTFDWSFNNKNFSCLASVPRLPVVTSSITVEVEFLPMINCKQQKYVVEIGKDFSISCSIRANPIAEVSWMDGEAPLDAHPFKTHERPLGPDELEVSLTISQVENNHLKSFSIHASNSQGNSSFTLVLAKKPGTRAEPMISTTISVPVPNSSLVSHHKYSINEKISFLACLMLFYIIWKFEI